MNEHRNLKEEVLEKSGKQVIKIANIDQLNEKMSLVMTTYALC